MIFEVRTAVNINGLVLWYVMPCCLVEGYQRLEGMYCLRLQELGWTQYLSIYLSMDLPPFVGPWPLFQFIDFRRKAATYT
jgi:hypothetical protein